MNSLIRATHAVLVASAILLTCWCRAEEKSQILFLHLKLDGETISLVGSTVKPGHLKTALAPDKKGEVYLELVSTNSTVLWSDVIDDPTVQRLEYEDPNQPGTLRMKLVKAAAAEFTARVPYHKDARQLRLHKLAKPASRAEAALASHPRKLLGSVAVPTEAAR